MNQVIVLIKLDKMNSCMNGEFPCFKFTYLEVQNIDPTQKTSKKNIFIRQLLLESYVLSYCKKVFTELTPQPFNVLKLEAIFVYRCPFPVYMESTEPNMELLTK